MSVFVCLHGWLLPLCSLFATPAQISVPTPAQAARFLPYFYLVHDLFIPDLPLVFFHYLSTLFWSVSVNTVHESFPLSYFSVIFFLFFFQCQSLTSFNALFISLVCGVAGTHSNRRGRFPGLHSCYWHITQFHL